MSSIWAIDGITPEACQKRFVGTMMEAMKVSVEEIGSNFIKASMPVFENTVQPYRILHGGASVALAETLGSMASNFVLGDVGKVAVGQSINANHIRPVPFGKHVTAITRPVHLGKSSHVWEIEIFNDENKLVCVSRLTMAIVDKPSN
ncbi:MAG: hotdog fold thioesterase [Deltaproteobacteria bacterium]|nr:MAG: hotdog fold thioesterase [Deltaproteobacteria bacterium]